MELEFQKNTLPCIRMLSHQTLSQEVTAELNIPEGFPDAGRVIGLWGLPQIRTREVGTKGMTAEGDLMIWALYGPEDGSLPRHLNTSVPFHMKWDLRDGDGARMRTQIRLKSLDGRVVNGRRILARADLAAAAEAFQPGSADYYTPVDPPKDLEILKKTVTLVLPASMTDKSFVLEEDLDLPGGAPACAEVVACQVNPRVTDRKVLGEKAVFKGSCGMHLVYMTTEDRLAVWDFEVPFSQFAELSDLYEEDAELQTDLLVNSAEVMLEEPGRALAFRCAMTAQCTVLAPRTLELTTDLYAPRRTVKTEVKPIPLKSRETSQDVRCTLEARFPVSGGNLVDCTMLSGLPRVDRSEATSKANLDGYASILYYDEAGALQGTSSRCTAEADTGLGGDISVEPEPMGPVQWNLGGGNVTVRSECTMHIIASEETDLTAITGATVSDLLPKAPGAPSLRLRHLGKDETLWSLAKASGSTVDAIRKANGLTGNPDPGKMLIIPVM